MSKEQARLLTVQETSDALERLRIKLSFTWLGNVATVSKYHAIKEAQDAKTASLVRKEIGEWLEKQTGGDIYGDITGEWMVAQFSPDRLKALQRGEMPEE